MKDRTAFNETLTSVEDLDNLYRSPSQGVKDKETERLDLGCRDFIAMSPFVLVGTVNTEGDLDVSPRGGPTGFVKVLDEYRLAIPDLNGNNRLDSIRNIIANGRVGLIFLIPGLGETLRVNGSACVTTDDLVLDLFSDEFRRPKSAIGVTIEHGFIHCAKSIRRSGLWEPDTWANPTALPSAGQILVDHIGAGDFITGAQLDEDLAMTYANDLAADRPGGPTASGD